jgi:ElaA protein
MSLHQDARRTGIEISVTWTMRAFDDLSAAELYDILTLRQRVFVVEQHCPFLDADGFDSSSLHLCGRNASGFLIAYLRLVPPGVRFAFPSIGRVVTDPGVRGTGLGRALMLEGMHLASATFPGAPVYLSAQRHLERFYASLGFVPEGNPYDEDGIAHITMVKHPA